MSKKIEDYMCTVEQSKRLKELSIAESSLFFWWTWFGDDLYTISTQELKINDHEAYPAFTSQELGELISELLQTDWSQSITLKTKIDDYYFYVEGALVFDTGAALEAQARAKFLIYLLEHKKQI